MHNMPSSEILITWTRMGKTVRTLLNMVQTCLYMFTRLHTILNMYLHAMHMYINIDRLYVACTYMFINTYICMYIVHTHA